jgi:hypothetical protein
METEGDDLRSSSESGHRYTRRLRTGAASLIVIGGAIFVGGAATLVTAYANTGAVATSENCSTWSASVTLNHNVTPDKWVAVVSTISGSPGFAPKQGYDNSFGLIWSASGAAPTSSMVTLNIFHNNNGAPGTLEFTTSGMLTPPSECSPVSISTTASAGGVVGTVVHDVATLTGGNNVTGTVTFKLFASLAACNAGTSPVFTANQPVSTTQPLTATSGNFTPTSPGHYNWLAHYNGNDTNMGVGTKCGDEPLAITAESPSITTTASAGGVIGTGINDSAIVTGSANPTGTVTFKLFPDAASCTAGTGALFTSTNPLSTSTPPTATSGSFTPATVGMFQWLATYNGDANNASVSSTCGSEPDSILAATPGITTSASAGGQVPVTVHDTATVSGGASPTGTVVFTLFADLASCNAKTGAVYTSPAIALSGGSATSGTVTLNSAGTFEWIASYSGDVNNAPVSSTCGAEPVTTTSGGGGVLGITTPNTGSSEALSGLTLGGFLALAGLGLALAGAILPRRNRI